MPTVEQITAMPITAGSAIRARANGQHQVRTWELGWDRHWYAAGHIKLPTVGWAVVADRRSPSNLYLIQVLYVAGPAEAEVGAA